MEVVGVWTILSDDIGLEIATKSIMNAPEIEDRSIDGVVSNEKEVELEEEEEKGVAL